MLDNTIEKRDEEKQKRLKRTENILRRSGLKFYIGKCIEQSLQPDKTFGTVRAVRCRSL